MTLSGWSWLRAPDQNVAEGQRHFEDGRYQEALEAFRAAHRGGGDTEAIHFDEGVALYRLAEEAEEGAERERLLDEAEEAFRRAAASREALLRSSAYYNLGNTMYQRGRYDDAIVAYKRALRTNPHNDDARYNLEMAQRHRQRAQAEARGPGQPGARPDGHGQGDQPESGDEAPEPGPGDDGQESTEPGAMPPDLGKGEGSDEGEGDEGDDGAGDEGDGGQDGDGGGEESAGEDVGGQEATERRGGDGDLEQPGPEGAEPSEDGGGAPPAASGSEVDRKLDALERMSQELQRRKIRGAGRSDPRRGPPKKDW